MTSPWHTVRNINVRQKLTILLLIIGLVPTLIASIFAYVNISRQLNAKTEDQLTSIVVKQQQKIDALLQNKQEDVLKLANRYDLQLAISDYMGSAAKDASDINKELSEKKIESSDIVSILITDTNNKVYGFTNAGDKGTTGPLANTIHSQGGQQNIATIQEDKALGGNKLYIATRLSINKKDAGTLIFVYKTDDFAAALADYNGLGTTGETVLAVKQPNGDTVSLFPLRFDNEAALNPNVRLNGLDMFSHGGDFYGKVKDYRGHDVIAAARPITATNWGMATKLDADEAFAPISQLRDTLLIIVGASSILIIMIALATTRLFTQPIIELTEKTRRIIKGDFTQRIDVKGNDEIGTLGTTFNDMANRLAESYGALEQKVAERTKALDQKVSELATANAKDEAILSGIGEGLVVVDVNGLVQLINGIAIELMALPDANVVGTSIFDWKVYDDFDTTLPKEKRPVYIALATSKKVVQTMNVIGADGSRRVVGVTVTPVIQDHKAIGAVEIIRDLTKEKQVDKMKTEFISLASHQLRTPLSAIRWFSEMLINGDAGKLNDNQQEFAQNVYSSAERMIELVSSLLNISRIESGRIMVDPQPTDLKELVGGIVNDLQAKIAERNQNLIISVHAEMPKINIDRRLIGQVYLNLLSNAIKYTPKGGEISVFISRKDDKVVSQITDNGYGIPQAEQHKMFQKFFRATNVVKVETDGTGLGMYLIKSIIDSSGGEIWFESEEGKGTTFWFSLPMSGMKAKKGEVTID
jgi:PAS domain S-box-containing protein